MLQVSLVPCTTLLEIDIKDRHRTIIQSMTLEIYVLLCSPTPLLAMWLETFIPNSWACEEARKEGKIKIKAES